jgi:hypothetical protein
VSAALVLLATMDVLIAWRVSHQLIHAQVAYTLSNAARFGLDAPGVERVGGKVATEYDAAWPNSKPLNSAKRSSVRLRFPGPMDRDRPRPSPPPQRATAVVELHLTV